jgi:hypothetical protein
MDRGNSRFHRATLNGPYLASSKGQLTESFGEPQDLMGGTWLDEIQQVQLVQAKRLLLEIAHLVAVAGEMTEFGTTAYPLPLEFFNQRTGKRRKASRQFRI